MNTKTILSLALGLGAGIAGTLSLVSTSALTVNTLPDGTIEVIRDTQVRQVMSTGTLESKIRSVTRQRDACITNTQERLDELNEIKDRI